MDYKLGLPEYRTSFEMKRFRNRKSKLLADGPCHAEQDNYGGSIREQQLVLHLIAYRTC
jgi:hypothetical protein